MPILVVIIALPLVIIVTQLALGLDGALGYSLYKLAFVISPLLYCRMHGISVRRDILRFAAWRNHLGAAVGLGMLAIAIFWGAYAILGSLLVDESLIVAKIGRQFSVTTRTVFLIAPVTILANSLLEEFFYRAFGFGQLRLVAPAWIAWSFAPLVFTVQHLLFIYHWVGPVALGIAILGLLVFAVVLQWLYARAGSVVAPWIVHAFGDIAMMGLALKMLQGL